MASSPRDDLGDEEQTRVDGSWEGTDTPDIDPTTLPGYQIGYKQAQRLYRRTGEHAAVSEPQTDSTEGRARTVTTARALRHSIRDDINLVVVSASLLRMAGFTRDAEALEAIQLAADRLVTHTDQLYNLATDHRPRWLRWLFG